MNYSICVCEVEDNTPGGGVKLEGEDDVISVTYLTDEATLRAQVTVEHVVGGVLQQRHQVVCILTLCYLGKKKKKPTHMRMFQGGGRQVP